MAGFKILAGCVTDAISGYIYGIIQHNQHRESFSHLDMVGEAVLCREPLPASVAEAVEGGDVVLTIVARLGAQMHLDVAVVGHRLHDHAASLAHLIRFKLQKAGNLHNI